MKGKIDEVTWSEDNPESNTWSCSGCDILWQFTDGGPKENQTNYCPKCGSKIIEVVPFTDFTDEREAKK